MKKKKKTRREANKQYEENKIIESLLEVAHPDSYAKFCHNVEKAFKENLSYDVFKQNTNRHDID